ncbi:MAG TPA: MaoC family dehydratase [Solirubrobacteraceae bacterium]|nr:MaoC family dehydratase [Solirubrobacteraceae bacterium]
MLTLTGLDEIRARVGEEIGVSGWHLVTQEDVDAFARVTRDEYFIHTDPERAKETPFGGTIAHGYYTLSLASGFGYEIVSYEGVSLGINYGVNRVRFPSPMPVGDRVRMRLRLLEVAEISGGIQLTTLLTFEREGGDKPVCVAESLTRLFA